MVERARRLRMGFAHSSPGASGDTARPNYVGPSGNGLVGADERGRKLADSRAYRMGAPVRFQKAVSRSKENAAVERRQANAHRHWAYAARRQDVTPRLSALRSLCCYLFDIQTIFHGLRFLPPVLPPTRPAIGSLSAG